MDLKQLNIILKHGYHASEIYHAGQSQHQQLKIMLNDKDLNWAYAEQKYKQLYNIKIGSLSTSSVSFMSIALLGARLKISFHLGPYNHCKKMILKIFPFPFQFYTFPYSKLHHIHAISFESWPLCIKHNTAHYSVQFPPG